MLFGNSISLVAVFITSIPSFYLLIGPLSYFYIRSIVKDNSKLSQLDYLHFFIFLLTFIGSLPFLFSTWAYKLKMAEAFYGGNFFSSTLHLNAIIPKKVNHLIRPFQTLIYTVLNWQLLSTQRKNQPLYSNKTQFKLIFNWLLYLNCLLTIAAIVYLFGLYKMITIKSKNDFIDHALYLMVLLIIIYSLINICIYLFPKIMYGLPIERLNQISQNTLNIFDDENLLQVTNNNSSVEVAPPSTQVSHSPIFLFTNSYIDEMNLYLDKCVVDGIYLDANFKLDSLSTISNIPQHHWTYYFNHIKNQNFIDWKNCIRIEYAKKMIEDGFLENQTFLSLATLCGYNAKSTFIRAFKLHTEMNPSDFAKDSKS